MINSQENALTALEEIRSIMQRSAKFISLSGWSGIWAGLTALAGAYYVERQYFSHWRNDGMLGTNTHAAPLVLTCLLILLIAATGAWLFTQHKVKRTGEKLWNATSRKMLTELLIPLGAGGLVCLAMLYHADVKYLAPLTLIFYGLGLINCSKYTFDEIRHLGMLEILLALPGLFFPGYGLILWALGFGVLHIIYGLLMWQKYDRVNMDKSKLKKA